MKSNHLVFTGIVVALALWVSNAKAVPVNQFEKLNFSLVATQQGLDDSETSPNVYVSTTKTSKIATKDILSLLATALNTNWPVGAQLAVEVTGRDIYVVDKTGTNPVFNVSTGINDGNTVVYFNDDGDPPVFSGKAVVKVNGLSQARVQTGKMFFHLFIEQNGIINIDFYFDGLGVAKLNRNVVNTTVTLSRSDTIPVTGDGTFGDIPMVAKGNVTGSGKWKDVPVE